MRLAPLFLLFASQSPVLLDEVFEIPASQWRFVPVTPRQTPARIECDFRVVSGNAPVRIVLMDEEEFRQLKSGDRQLLGSAEPAARGMVDRTVSVAREVAVVLENHEARGPIRVALRVTERHLMASQLSPRRRSAVIVISVAAFLAIVIYSGRKLRAAIR